MGGIPRTSLESMTTISRKATTESAILDGPALLTELKSCSMSKDLKWGRRIHAKAVESQNDSNVQAANGLIKMYAKCGSMVNARHVLESLQKPGLGSWTALLLGYAENGEGQVALDLFSEIKARGCAPDSVTYIAAIKACTSLAVSGDDNGKRVCLERGREIHAEIGNRMNHFVQSSLIDLYAKCNSMVDAQRVFDSIQSPDVVSWNSLILGYAENGEGLAALDLFARMKESGCVPTHVTYLACIKACTCMAMNDHGSRTIDWLKRGKEIHSEISCQLDHRMQSALIEMYSKCGSMVDARRIFDSIYKPDVVSWTVFILGYAENGEGHVALDVFSRMKVRGCVPDLITYVAALKACISLAVDGNKRDCLERGREIHSQMIGSHLDHCVVQGTLIDMYVKSGSIVEARQVFDNIQKPDVVSWTALLLGYAENGEGHVCLDLFSTMKSRGCVPNFLTYMAALKACGLIGALVLGRKLHSEISEFPANVVTCLVDFYAKCGSMVEARQVFDLHSKATDVTTWNALLAGYGSFGDIDSAFNLFQTARDEAFRPNAVTFVCMLICCSHAGLVEKSKDYFEEMTVQYGIDPTVMHYNCMIDILGRANKLNEAIGMLRNMPCNPDAWTWMALLSACRKWKNVQIGRLAFESLVDIDKEEASGHVLMAHIYGTKSMWEEPDRVLKIKSKLVGEANVMNEDGNMVKFLDGEKGPPDVEEKLRQLCEGYKSESTDQIVGKVEKEEVLCGHSERRAIVYGILKTPLGEPVRVFKNMRMCEECHCTSKMISKLSARTLMVRDASGFHVMENGSCSCGDYW